jgi:CBS domain containing-hemolysin-like protein
LAQLAEEGNAAAGGLLAVVEDPLKLDAYVATCQLGITASSLLLGFYSAAQVTPAVRSLLSQLGVTSGLAASGLVATGVLLFLTGLQVITGELVPKNIGVRFPERLALVTLPPMRWSIWLFRPLIWLFNGSARLVLKGLGFAPATEGMHVHSPDEIIILVAESSEGGILDERERRLLERTLRWRDVTVDQVMIPRTQILAASAEETPAEMLQRLAESPHSRLPLYRESLDNIVGVVHMKDLLCLRAPDEITAEQVMRPVPYVPENAPAAEVFARLQRDRTHIAIVLDEFGGTSGLVAIEDFIEALFGELRDEFDVDEPPVEIVGQRAFIRGDAPVQDVNNDLNMFLDSSLANSVGGLVLASVGHLPQVGEEVAVGKVSMRVEEMSGRGVTRVSVPITQEQARLFTERTL